MLFCFISRAWGVIKENSKDFSSPDGIGSRIRVLWPFQPHMVRSRHTHMLSVNCNAYQHNKCCHKCTLYLCLKGRQAVI